MLPRYKDIVDLIKKGATLEAQEKILELREAALELQEENIELREKLATLEAKIKQKEQLVFDGHVYWKQSENGKEGPFCPTCQDTKQRLVRLHKDGTGWWCHPCSKLFGSHDYA